MSDSNLEVFIRESNRIDPQPLPGGDVIPGEKPGDLLFDNHLKAIDLAIERIKQDGISAQLTKDVHRELTRGIAYYEDIGMSGQFRTQSVWIGGRRAPMPMFFNDYLSRWAEEGNRRLAEATSKHHINSAAWWIHHGFEWIHPFIDGNGRTGRILLNAVLLSKDQTPIVVGYEDRFSYYSHIQAFENAFNTLIAKKEA